MLLAVRTKFNIANSVHLSFVMESDGCLVDNEDLVTIAECNEPLMVLCGEEQKWSKVNRFCCLMCKC